MMGAVIRLPTAAPRKVLNPTPRRCDIAVKAGAAIHLPVKRRRPDAVAAPPSGLVQSPELLLILGILKALPEEQKRAVAREVICVGMVDDSEAVQAAAHVVSRLLGGKSSLTA